jgi:hypothetical protein
MASRGRSAAAQVATTDDKGEVLDARATGVEISPEPEPEPRPESNLAAGVQKYLSQMMSFVEMTVTVGPRNP